MVDRLAGRVALITGAASPSGIGFATASRLAAEGACVLLTDVDGDGARARATEIAHAGPRAAGAEHDVADPTAWERVLDEAERRWGTVDVLVNNAGIVILKTVDAVSDGDWNRQIDVNLRGPFNGCRAVIARLRRDRQRGAIVNVSSVAGLVGMRRCTAYAASKGGVRLMTKTLALETAVDGIRVNSVHPGVIQTEIQRTAADQHSAQIHAAIPMQRMGRPEDVAAMVAFLASDDAAYVTGAEFVVDGGLTAQ